MFRWRFWGCALSASLWLSAVSAQSASQSGLDAPAEVQFVAREAGEAVATISASCQQCDWGVEGREAATLKVMLDGKYSQHLMLVRGSARSDYKVTLGPVTKGPHALKLSVDSDLSAKGIGPVKVSGIKADVMPVRTDEQIAQSMAPILYARPNTVGKFTDVPVFMWYEIVPAEGGRQFRYSVIFTNEDGGTATDRLMATWGRTTDIEFVYGVTLDRQAKVVAEEFQGPDHEVPAFRGRHEGAHPLQWVSTDNNMVSESGPTEIRYAPAPERFDLTNASREIVMDAHPWTHEIASKEMAREKKLQDDPAAGSGAIPDPRRFVFVEACTELQNAAVAFSVHAADASGQAHWFDSDRGLPQFRIVRTGCFRGAVPLPSGAGAPDAVRFKAYTLPPKKDAPPPAGPASVTLTRVNRVFTLDESYLPKKSTFAWTGTAQLGVDRDWYELEMKKK
jgi:hypothetical protein